MSAGDGSGARFIFRVRGRDARGTAGGAPALLFAGAGFFAGAIFSAALLGLLAQATDLLYVMQAMDQMKLSPLRGGERAEDRMVQQFAVRPKLFFATCKVVIHFGDFRANLGQNSLRR